MIDIHLNVRVDAIKYYLYTLRKPVLNTFPQMTFEQYVHSIQTKKTEQHLLLFNEMHNIICRILTNSNNVTHVTMSS